MNRHPCDPDRSMRVEDALSDAETAWRTEHAELVGLLETHGVKYELRAEADPDEDGPNISLTFMLEGSHDSGRLYNATGGERALTEALRGLCGSPEARAEALLSGHMAAD